MSARQPLEHVLDPVGSGCREAAQACLRFLGTGTMETLTDADCIRELRELSAAIDDALDVADPVPA